MSPTLSERSKFFRVALCAVAFLLLAPPVNGARGHTRRRQEGGRRNVHVMTPAPEHKRSRFERFVDFLACHTDQRGKMAALLKDGPQFPESYDPGNFQINALLKGGWPVVLIYELEQPGNGLIKFRGMNLAYHEEKIFAQGLGQPKLLRTTLPPSFGPIQAGKISIEAWRDGPNGEEPARFRLIYIGAGKEAVASSAAIQTGIQIASLNALHLPSVGALPGHRWGEFAAISPVQFEPGQGDYLYSFDVGNDFGKWAAEIVRDVPKPGSRNSIRPHTVRRLPFPELIGPNLNPIGGRWNGLDPSRRRVPPGQYRVRVSVYWSALDRGWATRESSQPLNVH
jgi:hypothetical protein